MSPLAAVEDNAEKLLALLEGVGQQNVNVVAASGAALPLSTPDQWSVQVVTLTAACAFTLPAPVVAGQKFVLYAIQGGSGGYSATWAGASVSWINLGGLAPVLSSTVGAVDRIEFISTDGATWVGFPYIAESGRFAAASTVTLTSGTAVQDATNEWTTWYINITGAASGTVTCAIGPANTTTTTLCSAIAVPAATGEQLTVRLPPGWWIKATVANATIVASTVVVTG